MTRTISWLLNVGLECPRLLCRYRARRIGDKKGCKKLSKVRARGALEFAALVLSLTFPPQHRAAVKTQYENAATNATIGQGVIAMSKEIRTNTSDSIQPEEMSPGDGARRIPVVSRWRRD